MSWKKRRRVACRLTGRRVLVVEDEPLIALELTAMLNDAGAVVVGPGRDIAQSLRLIDGSPLSAALLDVRLGRDTVAPLARRLAERGVPFAFYTGQVETDAVRRDWPAAPVLAKPTPSLQLLSAIEALCNTPARPEAVVAGG